MHSAPHSARRPWTTLVLLAIAQFMVILDVTVVNVALPSIADGLGFSDDLLPWVITAYVLFTGGLMLLGGRAADLLGRKAVFLSGLAIFTTASLASGLAWSPGALIGARALQGLGAAFLLPSALSILTTTYSGHQRTVALAVWGALGSAGAAAGVLLGGVLTTVLSWHWIFFVNVPVGVAVGVLAVRHLALGAPAARERGALDLAGAVTLMAALVALVLAVDGPSRSGWSSPATLALFGAFAALSAAFVATERAVRRPLVPAATWRIRSLVSSAAVMLAATGILVGSFFLNTLLLQQTLDATPLETGLAFLPLALVILAGAHAAQHLVTRAGTRPVMTAGLALAAAGALLLSGVPDHAGYLADLLPGFVALGLGIGMAFVAVSIAAMTDVPHESAGLASGLMTTAHELGAALGVAVLGSIVTASTSLVDGYRDAFLATAIAAGVIAAATAVVVPSVRPAPGVAHSMH